MKITRVPFIPYLGQAIFDGLKTKTRRVFLCHHTGEPPRDPDVFNPTEVTQPPPYGPPGSRIAISENYYLASKFDDQPAGALVADKKVGRCNVWFAGEGPKPEWAGRVRTGRFMPSVLARSICEITEVNVRRLQDITEENARDEGVSWMTGRDLTKKLAEKFDGPPIYYIESETTKATSNNDFCMRCALDAIKAKPKEEKWGWHRDDDESDTLYRYCATCETPLAVPAASSYACETEFDEGILGEGIPDSPWYAAIARQAFVCAQNHKGDDQPKHLHRAAFRVLWDSINAERGHPWESNPWCWEYTFKRIEP